MHYEKLPQDNGERMENEKLLKEIKQRLNIDDGV